MDLKGFQKESYVFMIDSASRNRSVFPASDAYTIEFNSPFLNVCSLEILRAHIPRSEYNIDVANNVFQYTLDDNAFVYRIVVDPGDYSLPRLVSYLNERLLGGLTITTLTNPYSVSNKIYLARQAGSFTILPSPFSEALGMSFVTETAGAVKKDLSIETVIDTTRDTIAETFTLQNGTLAQRFESDTTGLLRRIRILSFSSGKARDCLALVTIKDDQGASLGEQQWSPGLTDTVTFEADISLVSGSSYTMELSVMQGSLQASLVSDSILQVAELSGQPLGGSLGISLDVDLLPYALVSDSLVDLTGFNNTVFIRCKEIEQVVFRERFGETKIHSGMGYVKLDSLSTNTTNLDYFQPFPPRQLSLPLARLKRLSFSLETREGVPYNTRGLDHQLVCRITYYKAPASS